MSYKFIAISVIKWILTPYIVWNLKKFVVAPNFKTNNVKLILDGELQKSGLERLPVFPFTKNKWFLDDLNRQINIF